MRARAVGLASLAAASFVISSPRAVAQVPQIGGVSRRPGAPVALAPRARLTVSKPIYVLNKVQAKLELSNMRDVPYRFEIRHADCWAVVDPVPFKFTPVGGRVTLDIGMSFYLPARGQQCPLEFRASTGDGQPIVLPLGPLQIEEGQIYTIENTWAIKPFVSTIIATRINAPDAPCEGMSAGLSGIMPIGLVEYEQDISFNLRSGINQPECTYDSGQPYRRLKPGWAIIDRQWKVERARGSSDACNVAYSTDMPRDTWFYVHSQFHCGGGPDNNNGVRLTLQRLTLIGPPNGSALDAFISGSY